MIGRFMRICAWLAAGLFTLSGVMLTYEVLARYFFTAPTIWAAELSQLCLIWGSLVAMAWALHSRRHIVVDALATQLPRRVSRVTDALALLFVAGIAVLVTWYGWGIFLDSFERGRTTGSMLDIPVWISELSVPLGFAFLVVIALIEAVATLMGRRDDLPEAIHE